jgi:hypothetical protein
MNPVFSFLEIDIYTVDGPVSSFIQYGEPAIRRLLDQLHPRRIFAQHHLLIAGDHSIAVFPCRAIARVDLIMDDFPSGRSMVECQTSSTSLRRSSWDATGASSTKKAAGMQRRGPTSRSVRSS